MGALWRSLAVWFAIAFVLTVVDPPPTASPIARISIVAGPIALLAVLIAVPSGFRDLMRRIPGRTLVMLHIVRLPVGALFVVLAGRDLLPYDFAWPAGIGDMIAGGGALGVAVLLRRRAVHPVLVAAWNVVGLLDFMNVQRVVATLAGAGRGAEFVAMQGPPLALIPYFGVPLLFFTHLYMLGRLARTDGPAFLETGA